MDTNTRNTLATMAIGVGAGIAGAAVTFLVMQPRVGELENRLTDTESQSAELRATVEDLLARRVDEPTGQPNDQDTDSNGAAGQPDPGSGDAALQFAYITKATTADGTITLTLDYAQFLTGAEAAAAAAAAGDESPPPNDYYISNVNRKLRRFEVDAMTEFTIALNDPDDTRTLDSQEFFDAFVSDAQDVRDTGYWVTISGGKITHAEEQWLP